MFFAMHGPSNFSPLKSVAFTIETSIRVKITSNNLCLIQNWHRNNLFTHYLNTITCTVFMVLTVYVTQWKEVFPKMNVLSWARPF